VQLYKVPLVLNRQPDGGYTVTSPALPELITEGDSLEEVVEHVRDALRAVIEIYEDLGRPLPEHLGQDPRADSIQFEHLVVEG
jgi:antitoxin HicB